MKLAWAAFGVATLVGVGYIIGKKVIEKRNGEDDFYEFDASDNFDEADEGENNEDGENPDVYAKAKGKEYGEKIRKASMFAVGAIKTSADKLGETISDIKSKDMVKKGEQTVDAVKETGENIRNDIKRDFEDFKGMVSSIEEDVKESDLFETAENLTEDIKEEVKNVFGTDRSDDYKE
ncbi:MAG: hypothetical protein FWF94_01070 [Oscillospiraceae bacterium]|nr:hypothetical protein [Oscillospiraceae bacterium]